MDHLLEFYGEECPHCDAMRALSLRLEKEQGVKISRFEIWHNVKNREVYDTYDKDICKGVPFFINTKTGKSICGMVSYEELQSWAKGL